MAVASIASLSAANAGLAADAPTVARWGYQLYGGRVGIGKLLPDIITGLAQQIDNGVYPGDGSNITSAAAGMDHIIRATDPRGIDTDVLRAGRAIAQRAIDAGHGNDGFARLTAMLTG
jgi:hypothetical protein